MVSDFQFDPSMGPFLSFNVANLDEALGFCRVTVPKGLLWAPDGWTVKIGDQEVTPNIIEDDDNTYLYFTYSRNANVEVLGEDAVPEFPVWAPILLMFVVFAVAVALHKRRKSERPFSVKSLVL